MDDNKVFWYNEFKNNKLNENYPAGTSKDPNAPWNKKDGEIQGKNEGGSNSGIKFKVESEADEFVILSGDDKELYAIFIDDIENMNDLGLYKEYWEPSEGETEYADSLDAEGIENWAWNEVSKEEIGDGLEAWESGDYMITKLDDELAQELYSDFAKSTNDKWRAQLKHFNKPLKRSEKLSYLDMMDDIKSSFPDVNSEWV